MVGLGDALPAAVAERAEMSDPPAAAVGVDVLLERRQALALGEAEIAAVEVTAAVQEVDDARGVFVDQDAVMLGDRGEDRDFHSVLGLKCWVGRC